MYTYMVLAFTLRSLSVLFPICISVLHKCQYLGQHLFHDKEDGFNNNCGETILIIHPWCVNNLISIRKTEKIPVKQHNIITYINEG